MRSGLRNYAGWQKMIDFSYLPDVLAIVGLCSWCVVAWWLYSTWTT